MKSSLMIQLNGLKDRSDDMVITILFVIGSAGCDRNNRATDYPSKKQHKHYTNQESTANGRAFDRAI